MKFTTITALAVAPLVVEAHFGLSFPWWRAPTMGANLTEGVSQWSYPCAGVPPTMGNRTAVPLTGGVSLKLAISHEWEYLFVNLGLGDNVTSNFNISLTPDLHNITGKGPGRGTLCITELPYPATFKPTEGQTGSLQVITTGPSGNALYNCADVEFRANATAFGGEKCETTPNNITVVTVTAAGNSGSNAGAGGAGQGASPTPTPKPAAGVANNANLALLSSAVGLAIVFGLGSSL